MVTTRRAQNFPLLRLTASTGTVSYARTFNWNNTGVQTGATPVSTQFTLPAGATDGVFLAQAVANGIASAPVLDIVAGPNDYNVIMQTDPNNAGEYQVLFNGTVRSEFAYGSFSQIFVDLSTSNIVLNIHETPAGVPVTVHGNAFDIVHVGDSGGVQNIHGNIYLDNVPNYNALIVDDTGDGGNIQRNVTVGTYTDTAGAAWGSITGLAPGSINYRLSDTATGIVIDSGSSGDNYTITGGASFQSLNINGGAGNDTFNVLATSAPVAIDGEGGSDQVTIGNGTLGSINGQVSVADTGGSAHLLVEDFLDTVGRTVTLGDGSLTGLAGSSITWTPTATGSGGVSYLSVLGGQGSNTWNVSNTSNFGPTVGGGYTYLRTGSGSNSYNTVNVKSTHGGLYVDGSSAVQAVLVGSNAPSFGGTLQGINGFVSVYNSDAAGYSTLTLDDTLDTTARTAAMYDGVLSGLSPAPIYWTGNSAGTYTGGVYNLKVYGGSGNNTWNINNTSNLYYPTYVSSGSGTAAANTVNVEGTTGSVVFDGGADSQNVRIGSNPAGGGTVAAIHGAVDVYNSSPNGHSQLTVDDSGDTTGQHVALYDGT